MLCIQKSVHPKTNIFVLMGQKTWLKAGPIFSVERLLHCNMSLDAVLLYTICATSCSFL